jgi:hypothetical protein
VPPTARDSFRASNREPILVSSASHREILGAFIPRPSKKFSDLVVSETASVHERLQDCAQDFAASVWAITADDCRESREQLRLK